MGTARSERSTSWLWLPRGADPVWVEHSPSPVFTTFGDGGSTRSCCMWMLPTFRLFACMKGWDSFDGTPTRCTERLTADLK